MNRLLLTFAVAVLAWPAGGDTVTIISGFGPFQAGNGGEFTVIADASLAAKLGDYVPGVTEDLVQAGSIQTFCSEPDESIFAASAYEVDLNSRTVFTNIRLTLGAAFLYQQFATGKLTGYNYANIPAGARKTSAAALQDALWYYMGGTVPYDPGNIYMNGTVPIPVNAFDPEDGSHHVGIMNVWNVGQPHNAANAAQDLFCLLTQVTITNLRATQRSGNTLVDLFYDLNAVGAGYSISVAVSSDGGLTFTVPAIHFTGEGVTSPVAPGIRRHILWDAGADLGGGYFPNVVVELSTGGASAKSSSFSVKLPTLFPTEFGISRQVNVNSAGHNIPGDAANEPSLCIDPNNPSQMAIGWRQFDTITSDFRQAGWAYSTNGGLAWTFPGCLEPGVFRSEPVLAADAGGTFYYLGLATRTGTNCDLFRSADGGKTWQPLGRVFGGDKPWMTVDKTTGPGRGNIYIAWSSDLNYANDPNKIFTRSSNGGQTWMDPGPLPQPADFGCLDVGPNGELYTVGTDGTTFWVNRSTNALEGSVNPSFDLTVNVDLGGQRIGVDLLRGMNPAGGLGQAWIAADRSTGLTRGNVYVLCTVTNDSGNLANVMFRSSTNRGQTWNPALRLNDDAATQHAWHWFSTLSVAPNGRIDACWYDTRHSPDNSRSELYYTWSEDGGRTWAPNRPLSPPFSHGIGYPVQEKIGDYITMVSLNEGACIAYAATFNGEQDIYFVRAELPITLRIIQISNVASFSWNTTPGVSYCVQGKSDLAQPWSTADNIACLVATSNSATVYDPMAAVSPSRFYRVVRLP